MLMWRDLQKAGYRIRNNDLTIDEWRDLAKIKTVLIDPQAVVVYKPKK